MSTIAEQSHRRDDLRGLDSAVSHSDSRSQQVGSSATLWNGSQFSDESAYVYHLTPSDISALGHFNC
jgi:hypothetical protein